LTNVTFREADIFSLPFEADSFDHVFVCFVLEHLGQPMEALTRLKRLLKPGGTVTVIEGDHGSTYFHPDSLAARAAIQCQITLQQQAGGNALIGRQLYPLMNAAGFDQVGVSPRMVYADSSRPDLVDGVGLIVGIDRFMSEARAVTNFSGNAVATVLVGSWTKTIDRDKVNAVLGGEDPFDELTMVDDHRTPRAEEPAHERVPVSV